MSGQHSLDKNVIDFISFIQKKADEHGYGEPTKSTWIKYMTEDIARSKLLVKAIVDYLKIPLHRRHRALDIGCGFGGMCRALKEYFDEVGGIECVAERVEWARKRFPDIEIHNSNAIKQPWPDNHFDLVVSNDVFEHITFKEQHRVVSEMMRVLKPGGYAFVYVPNRFQVMDEHNNVWFGTYLPKFLRSIYVKAVGTNKRYLHCYERTGSGWSRLFKTHGFKVVLEPVGFYKGNPIYPPSRFKIYLWKKQSSTRKTG